MTAFVLASRSPRRLELLAQIGLEPQVILPAEIDETPLPKENPREYVSRMAREKAMAIDHELPILAADTSVIVGQRILGKPQDRDQARDMLTLLSGRRHTVMSAVALKNGKNLNTKLVLTKLRFARISETALEIYLDCNEWEGKAGGYAIQGRAAIFVPWISGSYSNVVGLPLAQTASLFENF